MEASGIEPESVRGPMMVFRHVEATAPPRWPRRIRTFSLLVQSQVCYHYTRDQSTTGDSNPARLGGSQECSHKHLWHITLDGSGGQSPAPLEEATIR